jgi:hypothetical protein
MMRRGSGVRVPTLRLDKQDSACWHGVFQKSRSSGSLPVERQGCDDVERITVNLSDYPDLVVIYLGMRVNAFRGIRTLLGFGPKISGVANEKPDGLLAHDSIIYSLWPLHIGMRQYWRDFERLESWARSEPHRDWWRGFLRDSKGTGFWHEAYFMRGGMEAVYVDVPEIFGLRKFTPNIPAKGPMFSSRQRAQQEGSASLPSVVGETELYR